MRGIFFKHIKIGKQRHSAGPFGMYERSYNFAQTRNETVAAIDRTNLYHQKSFERASIEKREFWSRTNAKRALPFKRPLGKV